MTQYIMTPASFSLYANNRPMEGETAIFGDEHDISHGMGHHVGERILITDYLRQRLDANPHLHVYGEIPPLFADETRLFEDSTNKELDKLRDLKNSGYQHANRIHNVDDRHISVPSRIFNGDIRDVPAHVREVVINFDAPEVLNEIDDIVKDNIVNENGDDIADRLDSDDEEDVQTQLINKIVDAKMIYILKHNPDQAVDKIFYVGRAHKEGVENVYLDRNPEWIRWYGLPEEPSGRPPSGRSRVRPSPLAFTSLI